MLISVLWTHKPNTTDEEDMQLPKLSVLEALVVLGIITTLVTISSECAKPLGILLLCGSHGRGSMVLSIAV